MKKLQLFQGEMVTCANPMLAADFIIVFPVFQVPLHEHPFMTPDHVTLCRLFDADCSLQTFHLTRHLALPLHTFCKESLDSFLFFGFWFQTSRGMLKHRQRMILDDISPKPQRLGFPPFFRLFGITAHLFPFFFLTG